MLIFFDNTLLIKIFDSLLVSLCAIVINKQFFNFILCALKDNICKQID